VCVRPAWCACLTFELLLTEKPPRRIAATAFISAVMAVTVKYLTSVPDFLVSDEE
jgi:hypothetical protein